MPFGSVPVQDDITNKTFCSLLYYRFFVPYNEQLNNLERSVLTGKSRNSAFRIIAR